MSESAFVLFILFVGDKHGGLCSWLCSQDEHYFFLNTPSDNGAGKNATEKRCVKAVIEPIYLSVVLKMSNQATRFY